MRSWLRPLAALLQLVSACAPRDAENSGFSTTPSITSVAADSTSNSTGANADGSSTGTSSTSTGSADSSTSSGTTLILDVGSPDTGNPQPIGCQGKIDFLFVISRDGSMALDQGYGSIHERLMAAIPEFFATIEAKFTDFDYHILVTKGDPYWGSPECNEECPGPFEGCKMGGYPCELVDKASACDLTWGAGVVFNVGPNASNEPCDIAGGRRYLTTGQPNLEETFACVLQVGTSGYYNNGQALTAAVNSALNGPGGCNEGFLRDDALLFVTNITTTPDVDSEGTPASWAQVVFDAKGGDKNAVVFFQVGSSEQWCVDPPWDHPNCKLLHQFPLRVAVENTAGDYAAGFAAAADLLLDACSNFIPQ